MAINAPNPIKELGSMHCSPALDSKKKAKSSMETKNLGLKSTAMKAQLPKALVF